METDILQHNVYNVNFEIAAFIIIAILYYYLRKKYYGSNRTNIAFRRLVLAQMVTIFFDLVSSETISLPQSIPIWLNMVVNTAYFASSGVLCYLYAQFVLSFGNEKVVTKAVTMAGRVLLGFYLLILIANIPLGFLFRFVNMVYTHEDLFFICIAIPMSYFAEGAVTILFIRKRIRIQTALVLFFLLCTAVSGPLIQFFIFPDILFGNFFSIFSMVMCLFTLVSPDYSELTKKRAELFELQENLEKKIESETEKIHIQQRQREVLSGQIIDALAQTIDAGDANREGHSEGVAETSRQIAKKMGLSSAEVQKIYYMAILHDIGVIGVSEEVVCKKGKYTEEEFNQIKQHSNIGARILEKITELPDIALGAKSHHERFDGKGYPDGLSGNDIPLGARIIAVADAYDALTHDRSYRPTLSKEDAREEIRRCSGTQFDPQVVDAFLK